MINMLLIPTVKTLMVTQIDCVIVCYNLSALQSDNVHVAIISEARLFALCSYLVTSTRHAPKLLSP